jgi:GTP diphosphokinase / guanosine-3',5'-bis(diphosphate) 3'-diphosphatase
VSAPVGVQPARKPRRPPRRAEPGWLASARSALKFRLPGSAPAGNGEDSIPIRGFDSDMPVRFAPNGGAVPGDRIVGILTPGEGITIYPIHSPELVAFDDEPERWVDVRWDVSGSRGERFPARIRVSALNEPGSLAIIAEVIGTAGGNIDNLRMIERSRDLTQMEIDLEVWDLKHLNRIVRELRGKPVVSNAFRVNG